MLLAVQLLENTPRKAVARVTYANLLASAGGTFSAMSRSASMLLTSSPPACSSRTAAQPALLTELKAKASMTERFDRTPESSSGGSVSTVAASSGGFMVIGASSLFVDSSPSSSQVK